MKGKVVEPATVRFCLSWAASRALGAGKRKRGTEHRQRGRVGGHGGAGEGGEGRRRERPQGIRQSYDNNCKYGIGASANYYRPCSADHGGELLGAICCRSVSNEDRIARQLGLLLGTWERKWRQPDRLTDNRLVPAAQQGARWIQTGTMARALDRNGSEQTRLSFPTCL